MFFFAILRTTFIKNHPKTPQQAEFAPGLTGFGGFWWVFGPMSDSSCLKE